MDINSNNPLIDQLPTQNEVYQSYNNNDQTPSDYIPPPIYDNNIIQDINKDNNDNNEPRLSTLEAPPAFDNYIKLDVKDPLSQDNNNYPSKTDKDENNSNINHKLINHPLNRPFLEPIEEEQKPQDTNLKVKEPVYQLQVMPQQKNNNNKNNSSCCEECCCDDCKDCCKVCCDDCKTCGEDCRYECNTCCAECCDNCKDCCADCCKTNWSNFGPAFGQALGQALRNIKI